MEKECQNLHLRPCIYLSFSLFLSMFFLAFRSSVIRYSHIYGCHIFLTIWAFVCYKMSLFISDILSGMKSNLSNIIIATSAFLYLLFALHSFSIHLLLCYHIWSISSIHVCVCLVYYSCYFCLLLFCVIKIWWGLSLECAMCFLFITLAFSSFVHLSCRLLG